MTESVHINFPSQTVSDMEKMSPEYGLKVARAIEAEWFSGNNAGKYLDTQNSYAFFIITNCFFYHRLFLK